MKIIKRIVFSLLILAIVFAFCGCDGFSDAFEEALENALEEAAIEDYEYSEDGITEANMFYSSIRDTFNGSLAWEFVVEENQEEEEYSIKIFNNTVDGTAYKRLDYTIDNVEKSYIKIGDDTTYYINHTTKEVSTTNVDEAGEIMGLMFLIGIYGTVNFEDNEENTLWEFSSKNDAEIENAEGESINTVEFIYNSTEEGSSDTMAINFHKKLAKVERVLYNTYDDEELTTVAVYITEIRTSIEEGTFDIPTAADGYTIL